MVVETSIVKLTLIKNHVSLRLKLLNAIKMLKNVHINFVIQVKTIKK